MLPERIARDRAALGTVPNGTSVTRLPLSSVNVRFGGSLMSFGVPEAGGACFCADAKVGSAIAAASRKKDLRMWSRLRQRLSPASVFPGLMVYTVRLVLRRYSRAV